MRIIRIILVTILLSALAVISVVGLMVELPVILGWRPVRINELGESFVDVMRPRNGLLWMWASLSGGCLLVFLMSVLRRKKAMRIEVQMGGGRVVILDSAIKRYIRSALAELTDVTVKRIDLRETRSGISTDVHADVRTNDNLPVLERKMIQRVRAALAEDLGITSISDVHVYIRDFEVANRGHGDRHAREEEHRRELPEPVPYQSPTPATGPFDQVPAPAQLKGRNEPTLAGTDSNQQEKFFTPKPSAQNSENASVAALVPTEEAAAPVHEIQPATEPLGLETSDLEEAKPKRRGFFGIGRTSHDPASASQTSEGIQEPNLAEAEYNPATTIEAVHSDDIARSSEPGTASESHNPSTDLPGKESDPGGQSGESRP